MLRLSTDRFTADYSFSTASIPRSRRCARVTLAAKRWKSGYFGENGCLAVSFLRQISSILGSPFMARWMASLVAS